MTRDDPAAIDAAAAESAAAEGAVIELVRIYERSSEIQRTIIARSLTGKR